MAWTSPSTWVAGAVLTAAQLNVQLRDNLKAIGDPWTAYSPTWGGTIGNGTITGRYTQAGKMVNFEIYIVSGSTTSWAGSPQSLTIPIARATTNPHFFPGHVRLGATTYPMWGVLSTSTTMTLRVDPTTAGNSMRTLTATVPGTFTTGDGISVCGTYEAA